MKYKEQVSKSRKCQK